MPAVLPDILRQVLSTGPVSSMAMQAALVIASSLPTDIAGAYLLKTLCGAKNRRLYWVLMVCQAILVRLMRLLFGQTFAIVGLVLLVVIALSLGEGSLPRRVLLFCAYMFFEAVFELVAMALWRAVAGTSELVFSTVCAHAGAFASVQAICVASQLIAAFSLGPFARRIRTDGIPRLAERSEVAFVPFVILQGVVLYAHMTIRFVMPEVGTSHLVVEILIMILFAVADAAILHDARSYEIRTSTEMKAQLLVRVADSFMRHYRAVEAMIERMGEIRHDLRNQLQVADVLVMEGRPDEAALMLKGISALLAEGENTYKSTRLMSRELVYAAGFDRATGAGEERAADLITLRATDEDIPLRPGILAYLALHVVVAALIGWYALNADLPDIYLAIGALLLAAWLVSCPILIRLMIVAREEDLSNERMRVVREFLNARSEMGEHLLQEANDAEKLRRTMCSQVSHLEGLLAQKRYDEFHVAVQGERGMNVKLARYSEHSVADALTRVKAEAATREGVEFEAALDIPKEIALPPLELCTILSNVLDNAIAGASGAPEGMRWVRASATVSGGYLMVQCKNSVGPDGDAPERLAALRSKQTRPGLYEHGWGLRILGEVAERLGGTLETYAEDGVFTTRVAAKVS